ncbi:MAG: Hsp20/alpha crystallin family protein [Verrucomicrobiota bacterium]
MSQTETTTNRTTAAAHLEYVVPAVDIHHTPDGFTLEAEMPGVRKEGVEITYDDGKLTLTGHRAHPVQAGTAVYAESVGQAYRRVFDLDLSVDAGKIKATIDQGLLTVCLPKAESSKPRKIEVG